MPQRRASITGPLAGVLVMAGLFSSGLGLAQVTDVMPELRPPGFGWPTSSSPGPALAPSRPVRLVIPSIGVRAPITAVGLAPDGTIAAPPLTELNTTGWYEQGPTPGQDGPAIIVGHVDGARKPAVFARLATVRPGDTIEVVRRDNRVAVFQVDSVEQYDKSNLPAGKIYGDFSRPGLRLITCGGRWVGGDVGYSDNVVVFASLVASHRV